MTRLRQRDLVQFSKALEILYADTANATLSKRIVTALERVISCDFATHTLMDLRQRRFHRFSISNGVSNWPGLETLQNFFHEDPAANYLRRTRKSRVVKVSDFVSLRQYRSLGIYQEVFGPVGCDRRLGFAVQDKLGVDVTATLNRKHRDFSEEERTLLTLLQPHLLLANSQAYAQEQALLAHAQERAGLGEAFGAGLAELSTSGELLWLTSRAEKLLLEFFPNGHGRTNERLPTELAEFLPKALRPPEGALSIETLKPWRSTWRFAGPDQRMLKVRVVPSGVPGRWYLLLGDRNALPPAQLLMHALRLTLREAEVLHWLKEGKTNWEISAILGNSEKTVGKHLENIFHKLNVENRTAAVRMAMEANPDP